MPSSRLARTIGDASEQQRPCSLIGQLGDEMARGSLLISSTAQRAASDGAATGAPVRRGHLLAIKSAPVGNPARHDFGQSLH